MLVDNVFSGLKERRNTSTSAILTILNHLRVIAFDFLVPLGLVFYFKCLIFQDEVYLEKVSGIEIELNLLIAPKAIF